MYAIDNLNDSLAVTKRYLSSLGFGGWLKVAFVVLFLGGLGLPVQLFNLPFDSASNELGDADEIWGLLVVAVGIGIYAAFRYLVAVLEFVFLESLRSEAIHLRRYARANLKRGLRLVLFRAALWIALIIVIAIPIAAAVFLGDISALEEVSSGQGVLIGFSIFVAFVAWSAIYTLTTAFVVPIMLQRDRGPISAWRQFMPILVSNWSGALAYLLIVWLIGFAFWMLFAMIGFVVSLFGLILFVLVSVLFVAIDPNLVVATVVLFFLAYLGYQYVVSLVETPVRGYVRYYALLILGDTDETLDLIPEQRAAVRSDASPTTGTERSGGHGRRETTGWGGDETARGDRAEDAFSNAPSETDPDESPSWEGPTAWDGSSGRDDSSSWLDSDGTDDDSAADDTSATGGDTDDDSATGDETDTADDDRDW